MTESIDPRAKHREHIQQRTEYVRGKRGPVSFVWGNHVAKPGQHVPGAPGLWSPLPEGEAGLLVEAERMALHHPAVAEMIREDMGRGIG